MYLYLLSKIENTDGIEVEKSDIKVVDECKIFKNGYREVT